MCFTAYRPSHPRAPIVVHAALSRDKMHLVGPPQLADDNRAPRTTANRSSFSPIHRERHAKKRQTLRNVRISIMPVSLLLLSFPPHSLSQSSSPSTFFFPLRVYTRCSTFSEAVSRFPQTPPLFSEPISTLTERETASFDPTHHLPLSRFAPVNRYTV